MACASRASRASPLGGGGYELCGLYDVTSTKFGLADNLVTLSSNYEGRPRFDNGVDVTLSARFLQGGQFSEGLSVGRTVTDNCFTMDNPQLAFGGSTGGVLAPRTSPYCRVSPPWASGATQVKFLVVYPLPWALQTSATYQNSPGVPVTAARSYSNAEVRASASNPNGLKRDLSAGATANVTIDLIAPNSEFEDWLQQLDVRVTRSFQLGKGRVRANFDVYNLFNGARSSAAHYGMRAVVEAVADSGCADLQVQRPVRFLTKTDR